MRQLTNDEAERFADVMVEKNRHILAAYYGNPDDGLRTIIQTVIADTELLLTERITLGEWEKALAER